MDYEKAKERIKDRLNYWGVDDEDLDALQTIFPELVESEDERIRKELIDIVQKSYEFGGFTLNSKEDYERYIAWFEKQKEQKPAEWSEEDEKIVADFLYEINVGFTQKAAKDRAKDILSLLRPQPHWKPSEEQMDALEYFLKLWGDSDEQMEYVKVFQNVKSLYNDLKKL